MTTQTIHLQTFDYGLLLTSATCQTAAEFDALRVSLQPQNEEPV